MTTKIKRTELTTLIGRKFSHIGNPDVTSILNFLESVGACKNTTSANVDVALDGMDISSYLDMIAEPINKGDIVYVFGAGMFLVTDMHPEAAIDKTYFRGMKIRLYNDGSYRLVSSERSRIISISKALFIKHSTFDMDIVEKCSYNRFLAYKKIEEINRQIDNLTERC